MLSWFYFTRYIFSRRSGALVRFIARLSVLGIAMGVFCFIFVLSVMNGFNSNIKERILSVEPHLILRSSQFSDPSHLQESEVYKKLPSLGVENFDLFANQDVIFKTIDGVYHGGVARGLQPASLQRMFSRLVEVARKSEGDRALWQEDDWSLEPGEILIGIDLAHRLGVLPGDTLTVVPPEALLLPPGEQPLFSKVTVKKILTTNVAEIDSQFIFYSLGETLSALQKSSSRYLGIEVWLPDVNQVEGFRDKLSSFNVQVESWRDRNATLFFALRLEKMVMGLFLLLSGLIAICSVMTVVLLLVSQKRQEIGVMRAFGMSAQKVTGLFAQMGLFLSLLGVVLGFCLSVLATWFLKTYPLDILPGIYYDSQIPVQWEGGLILIVLLVALILSFLSGWLPARGLADMSPSQSIRKQTLGE